MRPASPPPPPMTPPKVEHVEDFTAHEWCNALFSDPTITHISKRHISDERPGASNTLLTRTLFTDSAVRAFLKLYRPGKGQQRVMNIDSDTIFTGSIPPFEDLTPSNHEAEVYRQAAKIDKTFDVDDADTAELLNLVSLGEDVDGGPRRLHGGVIATLLDQAMGELLSHVYENTSATSELNVSFKKAVTTPAVVLVRARISREKGRWVETRGWVEDGLGNVYTEGRGAFVLARLGGKM